MCVLTILTLHYFVEMYLLAKLTDLRAPGASYLKVSVLQEVAQTGMKCAYTFPY